MSGGELEAQRAELSGTPVASCDLCGVTSPLDRLHEIESASGLAEHDHVFLACETCQERVLRGEIDVETLVIEPDEQV